MALALASVAAQAATGAVAAEPQSSWNFTVRLDERAIGTHDFTLQPATGTARTLASDARFDVKFLGITVYRYRHHNQEEWNGNCLAAISASTDDHGDTTVVKGSASADTFRVVASTGKKSTEATARGCVVSFAYWNPEQLAAQTRLLDPGTGRIEAVTVTPLPAAKIEVHGQATAVTGLRIGGLKSPIDVWYQDGRWVGLDTAVDGDRKLSYRLM